MAYFYILKSPIPAILKAQAQATLITVIQNHWYRMYFYFPKYLLGAALKPLLQVHLQRRFTFLKSAVIGLETADEGCPNTKKKKKRQNKVSKMPRPILVILKPSMQVRWTYCHTYCAALQNAREKNIGIGHFRLYHPNT